MLFRTTVKFDASVPTEFQVTVSVLLLASQEVPWPGEVTVRAKVATAKERAAERREKARIALAGKGGYGEERR